jgi:RNA polymerase sigma factor (sigma-70 family)
VDRRYPRTRSLTRTEEPLLGSFQRHFSPAAAAGHRLVSFPIAEVIQPKEITMSPPEPTVDVPYLAPSSPGDLAALVRAATAGEKAAFAVLVGRYQGLVRGTAFRVTRNVEDAHDVTQQTWLILLRKIDTLKSPESLPAWLATTARREALRLLRERSRNLPLDGLALELLEDPEDSPEEQAERHEMADRVRQALHRLPSQRAHFLVQLVGHKVPYAQASATLGCAQGSLGPLRARYLQQLGTELDRGGGTAA